MSMQTMINDNTLSSTPTVRFFFPYFFCSWVAQGRGDRNSKEISAIGLDLSLVSHWWSFQPQNVKNRFVGRLTCTSRKFGMCIKSEEKGQSTSVIQLTFQGLVSCVVICCSNKMITLKTSALQFFFVEAISSLIWYTVVIELYTVSLPHQRSTTPQTKPRISCTPDSGTKGPSFDTFFIVTISQASKESLFCCRRSQRMLF